MTDLERNLSEPVEQPESSESEPVEAPAVDAEAARKYAAWKRKLQVSNYAPVCPLTAWLAERERLEALVERHQERYDTAPTRALKARAERRLDAAEGALLRHFELGDETLPPESVEAAYWARVEAQLKNPYRYDRED